ncbi:hypothetical protein [Citricoccus sp. GCM10030269]|uniref:hypothetical protein n=1 Tax=Citricoccus sp. GCM10030269 TaxID=3273388 RepID=UPI00361D224A
MSAPQDPREGRRENIPPTAVRLLPVILVTFGLNMLIDQTTDWPMLLRWLVALGGGMVVQIIVVRVWASRQR